MSAKSSEPVASIAANAARRELKFLRTRLGRTLNKDAPIHRAIQHVGCIIPAPVLGGLHHHYCRI